MLEIIAIALRLLSLAMLIGFLEYSLGEPFKICHISTNFFFLSPLLMKIHYL